ncbi:S-layer homology domain-containing protein [Paenibacillus woosongensis]|uniref:S-layer homology domain-containing protein n=1 Tax=Paenibacillus woosongensis TaxID=307580 RepID=A0AA95I6A0_9BACL|nr:S-layer homology domain-containing protein [Paenibacillus woosongensis]WHX48163.1 S-layer homology domain-containing protein [Paenibacillus woosongensis]
MDTRIQRRSIALMLVLALILSMISGMVTTKAFAAGLPDGTQDFTGYTVSGSVRNSPDGFFTLSASRSELMADGYGAYINANNSLTGPETVYFEITAAGSLGSFELDRLYVGEYEDGSFSDVTVKGYASGNEQFSTVPYSQAKDLSITADFPIDYSVAHGKSIDSFRVYYTKEFGTKHEDFNLITFTINNASVNPPSPTVSTEKAITGFSFDGLTPAVTGSVNEAAKTVALTVPYGTNVTALVPTITHTGASVSPASGTAQDFTNPVTYTVTAADATTQQYVVTVVVAVNPAKAITSFAFNGLTPAVTGTVNEAAKTVALTVPYGTNVTALVPTITHTGASVSPNSDDAQDFTNPVTYTVTAADSSTQQYVVTVTVAANPAKAITGFAFNGLTPAVTGTVDESAKTVALTVPYGTNVTALVPTITHTGASVSPNSNVAQDFTNPVTYTVTAADSSTQQYVVTVTVAANPAKAITGFAFNGLTPAVTGTVDESAKTVALTVPYGTNVTALVPTITHTGASVSPNSNVAQDFMNPVTYTVTAADATTQQYVVTVTVAANPAKAITGFAFNGLTPAVTGTVDESAKTVALTVPYGTNVTALVPTITHTGASVSPNSDDAQDFTNPVTYTVTAADSSTQQYVVTVTVAANPAKAITGFAFNGLTPAVTGTVDESAKTVALTVPYGTNVTALVPTITHTGASVSPNSDDAQDFTNPVTYTVTAADSSTQQYSVTVTVAAMNAPSAPVIQSAIGGDAHATITWNPVTTAAGYNVYMSTTPGAYGTALGSVVSTVYSYTALDLTNGTTYYFMIRATNAGGESPDSNEASATPQVPAPGVPNLLTAESGNAAITLTWAPVSGSTGYNIYQRLGSDTYGAEVATVTGSVYNYQVTGLTNGTMYYFAIKAVNPGGISDPSNEVSATPMTVPSAPTGVRAVGGNGQVTITFTSPDDQGGSPITGYEVEILPDHRTVTGVSSPITVTGLTNGRAYTFVVRAINSVGSSVASVESNAVTPQSPRSDYIEVERQVPNEPNRSTTEVEVLVNGKREQAGIAATTEKNGRTIMTITLDPKKLNDRLQAEGSRSVITIPFSTPSDVVIGVLNGQMIKDMEVKQETIEIKTEKATYTLPALQINIDAISEQIGREVELEQIQIEIEISEPTEEQLKVVENAVHQGAYTLVIPPLNFSVRGSYGDMTVDVSRFNAYVKRTLAIPDGVDPNKITTGVVIDSDGTVRHVPTTIELIDGKYYATIHSLTNSMYAVISNPVAFKDVAGHWAEEAVNEMGSRMVVSGSGKDLYNPDQAITRAEFAAIMVRALGLKADRGATSFSDVRSSDWYSGAVQTALAYELIRGYEDGTFGPQQQITREQAMVVIARAMEVTGLRNKLPDKDANKILQSYVDAIQVSVWARDSVADVLQAGIITGRSNSQLAPQAFISRAEVAVIIQRLLQQSELI